MQPLAIREVARERVLGRDGDRLELEVEIARIDALRAVAEERAERAGQQRSQLGVRERGQRSDRLDTGGSQPLLRTRPDAGKEADRKRGEELRLGAGRDDGDSTGLAPVGGDLAHDLRGGHPERAREARPPAHGGLDRRRDRSRAREVGGNRAEVEVALVDPGALEPRDDLSDRVPHDARVLAVERMPGPQENGGRAAPQRLGGAHRRVDPELPCRVVGRRHDSAAVRVAADDERLLAQLGILELLDGREERVEVEVGEDPHRRKARDMSGT